MNDPTTTPPGTEAQAGPEPKPTRRRRRLVVAAVLGGLLVVGVGVASALSAAHKNTGASTIASVLIGQPAPVLGGEKVGGGHASLAELRGRWVIVNFFASWCVPCQKETPELVRFAAAHRAPKDPAILGVVYMDDDNSVRSFVADHGVTWPLLAYRSVESANAYGVAGIPVTLMISPDGHVVSKALGGLRAGQLDTLLADAEHAAMPTSRP